jgi:hypothetical protein
MDDKAGAIRRGCPRGPGVGDTPSIRYGFRYNGYTFSLKRISGPNKIGIAPI